MSVDNRANHSDSLSLFLAGSLWFSPALFIYSPVTLGAVGGRVRLQQTNKRNAEKMKEREREREEERGRERKRDGARVLPFLAPASTGPVAHFPVELDHFEKNPPKISSVPVFPLTELESTLPSFLFSFESFDKIYFF